MPVKLWYLWHFRRCSSRNGNKICLFMTSCSFKMDSLLSCLLWVDTTLVNFGAFLCLNGSQVGVKWLNEGKKFLWKSSGTRTGLKLGEMAVNAWRKTFERLESWRAFPRDYFKHYKKVWLLRSKVPRNYRWVKSFAQLLYLNNSREPISELLRMLLILHDASLANSIFINTVNGNVQASSHSPNAYFRLNDWPCGLVTCPPCI